MTDAVLMNVFGSFAAVLGLVIGSFLNVCIARLPHDRSLWPPSACPRCGTRLRPLELVPVLSWVVQGGRCRHCNGRIAPTYPLIELLTGMLAWLLYRKLFVTPADLTATHLLVWVLYFGFLCALVVAAFVDLRHRIIPDETSLYVVPVGFLGGLGLSLAGYDGWLAFDWRNALFGLVGAGGFLWVVSFVGGKVLHRDAMGGGDVRLMAMIGVFLGLAPGAWMVLLWGSVLGSVISLLHLVWTRRRGALPFGPSLAFAAATYVLYGDVILHRFFPGVAALWL